jgi:hypothetical protein
MNRTALIEGTACVAGAAISLALAAGMCAAQTSSGLGGLNQPTHQTGTTAPASNGANSPFDSPPSVFPDTSKQKRNDERQRRLVSDTQKLVALTAQLKAEVASTGAEVMSPEMLKQMDEIEKLAKSVKDKMRD